MFKVIFLGTSGSTPTDQRGLPSVCIEYEGDIIMFDCGEGTQRQMMINKINFSKVRAIFLSHIHGDHTIGVAGLVRTLALNKRASKLEIFVPKGYENAVRRLLDFDGTKIGYEIAIRKVESGIIYTGKGYSVKAFRLSHTVPAFGFSFEENSKMKFDRKKAERLGIVGPMYSKLEKDGTIKVDRKTVKITQVARMQNGRKVVYATDTRPVKETVSAARHANLLIHEATYTDELKDLAAERMHSTALEAAKLAKKANVNNLILTHISARYRKDSELLKEARNAFKRTEVAKDGMSIDITGP